MNHLAVIPPEIPVDYAVTTEAQAEEAGEILKRANAAVKDIEERRVSITGPMNESLKRVNAEAKESSAPWNAILTRVKAAVSTFRQKQQEQARLAQEAADKAARQERERLERQAQKAHDKGDVEKASGLAAQAASTVPVTLPKPAKVEGVTTVEGWGYEITNEQEIPRQYLMPNETMIGSMVRSTKGKVPIPGVRIFRKDSVRVKS